LPGVESRARLSTHGEMLWLTRGCMPAGSMRGLVKGRRRAVAQ